MLENLTGTFLLFYCTVALIFFLFMIVLLVVGEVRDRKSSILSTREQFAAMVMAVIALACRIDLAGSAWKSERMTAQC